MLKMQLTRPCFLWRCQERKTPGSSHNRWWAQHPLAWDGFFPCLPSVSVCVQISPFISTCHIGLGSIKWHHPILCKWCPLELCESGYSMFSLCPRTSSCQLCFSLQLVLGEIYQSHRAPKLFFQPLYLKTTHKGLQFCFVSLKHQSPSFLLWRVN